MPLKEIAQVLKITEGTVKSMLFRAIQRLQKELAFYRKEIVE
ncbi:MAG TPA: sigma factor-like helix-turn-helix DNA-binding protein [bacterium]